MLYTVFTNGGHAGKGKKWTLKGNFLKFQHLRTDSICYVHFYESKSIIWHSLSIVHWGISKTVFEAFWT